MRTSAVLGLLTVAAAAVAISGGPTLVTASPADENLVNLEPISYESGEIARKSEVLKENRKAYIPFKASKDSWLQHVEHATTASLKANDGKIGESMSPAGTARPTKSLRSEDVYHADHAEQRVQEQMSRTLAKSYHEDLSSSSLRAPAMPKLLELAAKQRRHRHSALAEAAGKVAPTALVETSSGSGVAAQTTAAAGSCEVCVYVLENKQMHQPFLCRGLKDPAYQQTCVTVLISMMWWLENQVYWINYGCQREGGGAWEWVKPCPAHAICAWIQNLYDRQPFCPVDPKYRKPA